MSDALKRKYALTKIATGDYLLPSNDAATIWRIQQYTDGPSGGLDWPRDREMWRVLRWTGSVKHVDATPEADEHWAEMAALFPSRRAAIDYAVSRGPTT